MTALLFRQDAYRRDCDAHVVERTDRGGVVLDRTVFYAAAGGQPGDKGTLIFAGGSVPIATALYDEAKNVVHMPAGAPGLPAAGAPVRLELDWPARYRNMRAHTLMHLLCACVPFPVTGGAITEDGGRIDFDIAHGRSPDKDELADRINDLIRADHPVSAQSIPDAELSANPQLIRTMSVKPPMGTGFVRLVAIGENGAVDLQPCGGTHVRSTAEIGSVAVAKIESKGKQNRRIRLVFA